jgi:hypothetical protein
MSIKEQDIEALKAVVAPTVLQRFLLVQKEIFSLIKLESSVSLSNQFRYNHDWTDSTLCYNEVDSSSFLFLLSSLKDFDIGFNENAVFVDVGCGIGKTLVIVAILNTFSRIIGIEICDGLCKKSVESVRAFTMNYRSPLDQSDIEVIEGDGTFIDWSFADLVFICATSFSVEMMERITKMANKMNSGSVLILINRRYLIHQFAILLFTSIFLDFSMNHILI